MIWILIYLIGCVVTYIVTLNSVKYNLYCYINDDIIIRAVFLSLFSWIFAVIIILIAIFDKFIKWQLKMWN